MPGSSRPRPRWRQAQAQLKQTQVVAPFAGQVGAVSVRPGELATPGQPVLMLGDTSKLRVETTDLRETDVTRLKLGMPVELTFDALPGQRVPGHDRPHRAHEHHREGQHQLHGDRGNARSRSELAVGDDGVREYSGGEVDEGTGRQGGRCKRDVSLLLTAVMLVGTLATRNTPHG